MQGKVLFSSIFLLGGCFINLPSAVAQLQRTNVTLQELISKIGQPSKIADLSNGSRIVFYSNINYAKLVPGNEDIKKYKKERILLTGKFYFDENGYCLSSLNGTHPPEDNRLYDVNDKAHEEKESFLINETSAAFSLVRKLQSEVLPCEGDRSLSADELKIFNSFE